MRSEISFDVLHDRAIKVLVSDRIAVSGEKKSRNLILRNSVQVQYHKLPLGAKSCIHRLALVVFAQNLFVASRYHSPFLISRGQQTVVSRKDVTIKEAVN